ncbi:hypothetical protein M1D89_20395 [Arthrobacter sp. D3-18]
MPRLRNSETGLVVHCEGDLAERYQSRGWLLADAKDEPAVEVASEEPQNETPDNLEEAAAPVDVEPAVEVEVQDEKPARRSQARRR